MWRPQAVLCRAVLCRAGPLRRQELWQTRRVRDALKSCQPEPLPGPLQSARSRKGCRRLPRWHGFTPPRAGQPPRRVHRPGRFRVGADCVTRFPECRRRILFPRLAWLRIDWLAHIGLLGSGVLNPDRCRCGAARMRVDDGQTAIHACRRAVIRPRADRPDRVTADIKSHSALTVEGCATMMPWVCPPLERGQSTTQS